MSNLILYVLSGETFKEYQLPNSLEGIVTIDINPEGVESESDYLVPIYADSGHWSLREMEDINMKVNGQAVFNRQLVAGDVINVASIDGKCGAIIYVDEAEFASVSFDKYSLGVRNIKIGFMGDNSIIYKGTNVSENHAVIDLESGRAEIKANGNNLVFVNGRKTQSKVLNFGDIINIMGLKIVYFSNFIAINRPKGLQNCNLNKYLEVLDQQTDVGNATGKAKNKSYFQRSPRIIKKLDDGQINIDAPPAPNTAKEQPLILTMGPSFLMGIGMMVSTMFTINSSRNNPSMVIPGIVMTGCMLVGIVLWPILTRRYQKKTKERDEKKRVKRYRQYMQKVYAKLEERIDRNRKILSGNYPEPTVLINRAVNKDRRLWERMPSNKDFLELRLGVGTRPSLINVAIPPEHFTMEDDPLMDELNDINKDFITVPNIPITASLFENNMLGVIGERKTIMDIVMSMIIQISSQHSYDEVKLVCIYGKNEAQEWNWIKRLPHVWGPEKAIRFIASSRDEARDVFHYLNEVLGDREESLKENSNERKMFLPHFVVIIADPELAENEPVMRYLTNGSVSLGVTTVFAYEKLNMLPKECNSFVQCNETESTLYHRDNPEDGLIEFKADPISIRDLDSFSCSLAGIKVKELASAMSLPSMLTFLEMYKVGRIEHLEIKRRWRENLSYRSLEAPLGIKAGDTQFFINIHEKYHGPHGLIAGMTGSGKSEFIQSLILSMAINYHPYDVSFILIDYKGGGMANCFIGLPHISGTITNLGGSQIRRSLVSLQSELKRRQRIFAEYGVNHIDKYQQMYKENKAKEPLPHLVIVSDEFAELKSQQPEFMNELVSTARIGRSLGVHLILATQKPSGVVDDQIWSNTRFRICLKVLDKADSNEMLKRQEAAYITQAGRCYVQVGNDEIFELVQSGWSGAPYVPTDKIENDGDKQVMLIDGSGRAIKTVSVRTEAVKSSSTQLSAVVDYISDISVKDNIKPLKLWLEPLEEVVFYDKLVDEKGWDGQEWKPLDHWMCAYIGIYDDPKNQRQDLLKVDIGSEGHILLYGAPGTGKTTFLQTLVYSLVKSYSPELLNLYFLDFGGRTMGYYNELPHTGGVLFSDDADKLDKLFKLLSKELEIRKRKFAEYGVGSLQAYMQISGKKEPAMVVIIDNYSAFSELYPDSENIIVTLSREGGNYGVYLIITTTNTSSMRYRVSQNIKLMYALQLNDKYEYSSVVGNTDGLEPENVKGRGLAKLDAVLEYQTALAGSSVNEGERVSELRELFKEMKANWKGRSAKPIPFVPEEVTVDIILDSDDGKMLIEQELIPIGYDINEAEIVSIDLGKNFTYSILGFYQGGKTNFLKMLLRIVKARFDWKVYVVDNGQGDFERFCTKYGADDYICDAESFDSFINPLVKEMQSRHKDLKAFRQSENTQSEYEYMRKYPRILVLIDDFDSFFKMISETALSYMENLMSGGSGLEVYFVFTGDPEKIKTFVGQPLYSSVFGGKSGILLGGSIDDQIIFSVNMGYQQRSCQYDTGMGYLIEKNDYTVIKTPIA